MSDMLQLVVPVSDTLQLVVTCRRFNFFQELALGLSELELSELDS